MIEIIEYYVMYSKADAFLEYAGPTPFFVVSLL